MSKTYKQLSEDLDNIMAELQNEDSDIDESITKYKQATELIQKMEDHLNKAKLEITKIEDSIK
ncbi:exodeoxyribonuclease VII small subunit [Candidatus Saccharibacteria bacterium]|nr:exodeoxyribonuclease VII small subunit [Candidatus Saccharibacteria bacterium]